MLSIYPILTDEDEDSEYPHAGWDLPGYHDNRDWVVTYQQGDCRPIETLYTGDKGSAIRFYRGAIEAWR